MADLINIRLTKDSPAAAVWGSNPEVLIEFSTTEAGTIPPKELYEMAYQMAFDTEAKERVAMLQNEISAGIPLKKTVPVPLKKGGVQNENYSRNLC